MSVLLVGVMALELFAGPNGWQKLGGGCANFEVKDGEIRGECIPGVPGNTFLATTREYGDFEFECEYLIDGGNSGVQFRSAARPQPLHGLGREIYGYQAEITPDGGNAGRIYDENHRGFFRGIVWLDHTPESRSAAAKDAFRPGEWNSLKVVCRGFSIRTWVNGVLVTDILDDYSQKGIFGFQIHAQKAGTKAGSCRWRNISIKELTPALGGWRDVTAVRDVNQLVSTKAYADRAVRVTWRGGVPADVEGLLWDEFVRRPPACPAFDAAFVEKVWMKDEPNVLSEIIFGDRVTVRLNGFELLDMTDPAIAKAGRIGLNLPTGDKAKRLRFVDWEVFESGDAKKYTRKEKET